MYDDGQPYVGDALAKSFNWFASTMGRDRGNLQEKIKRSRYEGIPITESLDRDLFDAACMLHDETPLHSYPRPLMSLMRALRKLERTGRHRITGFRCDDYLPKAGERTPEATNAAEKKRDGAAALRSLFAFVATDIAHIHHFYIKEGIALLEKTNLTDDDRLKQYTAASALLTLVDLWDEAATLMLDLEPDDAEDFLLDFEFLGIENLRSVVDVAQLAFDLYEDVDASLLALAKSTDDEHLRRVITHDRQIAGTNMASISSYGFDWMDADRRFLAIICADLEAEDARNRSRRLAKRGHFPLQMSLELFKHHNDHVVLGRNVIRMAVQQKNQDVLRAVAQRLSELHGCDLRSIFDIKLAGLKPIKDEPHPKIDDEVRSWLRDREAL